MPSNNADSPSFLVDDVLPTKHINIISGPSGSGKSIFLAQLMDDWSHERSVFGHVSHAAPFCYISANQPRWMIRDQFDQLGIDWREVPHFSLLENTNHEDRNLGSAISIARKNVPHGLKVLFIAGFSQMMSQGKVNDDRDVSRFLIDTLATLRIEGLSIGGATLRAAKAREGAGFASPIDRIMGSTAWSELSATKMIIEPADARQPTHPGRTVFVLPKHRPPQRILYEIDEETGRMELADVPNELLQDSQLDAWLQVDGGVFTTTEMKAAANVMGISPTRVTRWLRLQRQLGVIKTDKRGVNVVQVVEVN